MILTLISGHRQQLTQNFIIVLPQRYGERHMCNLWLIVWLHNMKNYLSKQGEMTPYANKIMNEARSDRHTFDKRLESDRL